MGWWSLDIMGGDTPLDIQEDLNSQYSRLIITPEEAITYIVADDDPVTRQVVGFLMVKNGLPLNEELKQMILDGIDAELDEPRFTEVEERNGHLKAFRTLLTDYPLEGAKVETPHQKGLFEQIAEHIKDGKPGLVNKT